MNNEEERDGELRNASARAPYIDWQQMGAAEREKTKERGNGKKKRVSFFPSERYGYTNIKKKEEEMNESRRNKRHGKILNGIGAYGAYFIIIFEIFIALMMNPIIKHFFLISLFE